MTERKELGRIKSAYFGYGGYQDAMMGLTIDLGGKSWGVTDFKGAWAIERTDNCQWTHEDRLLELGRSCMFLNALLQKAGKTKVSELAGVPVEVTFDGMTLRSWRILDEVLP